MSNLITSTGRPKVIRGGKANSIGNGLFYMTGKKHSAGGIDIGKSDRSGINVEGGEVVQTNKDYLRVFSSIPFLDGISPAQRVMRGDNPDLVFNAQERFKAINGINDDGSKYRKGGLLPFIPNLLNKVYHTIYGYNDKDKETKRRERFERAAHDTAAGDLGNVASYIFNHNKQNNVNYSGSVSYEGNPIIVQNTGSAFGKRNMGQDTPPSNPNRDLVRNLIYGDDTNFEKYEGKPIVLDGKELSSKQYVGEIYPYDHISMDSQWLNTINDYINNNKVLAMMNNVGYYRKALSDSARPTYDNVNDHNAVFRKEGNKYYVEFFDDFDFDKNYAYDGTGINKLFQKAIQPNKIYPNAGTFTLRQKVPIKFYNINKDEFDDGTENAFFENLLEERESSKQLLDRYYSNSFKMGGLSRSKDYGSSKKPYPNVKSSDFAGGNRSYPIPTIADARDALRLAGLHGRSDVKAKVYSKYPSLRKPFGGILSKYVGTNTKSGIQQIKDLYDSYHKGGTYGGGRGTGGGAGSRITDIPEYETTVTNDTIWVPTEVTFNDAFARARRQGLKQFNFNGGTYTTDMSDNPNWEVAGNARKEVGLIPIVTEKKHTERKKSAGGLVQINGNVKNGLIPSLTGRRAKAAMGTEDDGRYPNGFVYNFPAYENYLKRLGYSESKIRSALNTAQIQQTLGLVTNPYVIQEVAPAVGLKGASVAARGVSNATKAARRANSAASNAYNEAYDLIKGFGDEGKRILSTAADEAYNIAYNGNNNLRRIGTAAGIIGGGAGAGLVLNRIGNISRDTIASRNPIITQQPVQTNVGYFPEEYEYTQSFPGHEEPVVMEYTEDGEPIVEVPEDRVIPRRGTQPTYTDRQPTYTDRQLSNGLIERTSVDGIKTVIDPQTGQRINSRTASILPGARQVAAPRVQEVAATRSNELANSDIDVSKVKLTPYSGTTVYRNPNIKSDIEQGTVSDKLTTGDYISAISNGVGAGLSYLLTDRILRNSRMNPNDYVLANAQKLRTNYNINPQLDTINLSLGRASRDTRNNTASSQVGYGRRQLANVNATAARNELYGTKYNQETQLGNQDRINAQTVDLQNAQMANTARRYASSFNSQLGLTRGQLLGNTLSTIFGIPTTLANLRDQRRYYKNTIDAINARDQDVDRRMVDRVGWQDYNYNPYTGERIV